MSDAATLAKQPIEITLQGKAWKITPLTLRDIGKVESRMRSQKLAVYMDACKLTEVDPQEKARRVNHLAGIPITQDEIVEGMQQPSMFPYVIFLALSPKHPELTEDGATELISSLQETDLEAMQTLAQSMSAMNSGVATEGEESDPTSPSDGPGSP